MVGRAARRKVSGESLQHGWLMVVICLMVMVGYSQSVGCVAGILEKIVENH